jgi:hypothetical protein
MKLGRIILNISLITLFLLQVPVHAQSSSREALGESLVESIKNKDLEGFKSLLIPKEVAVKLFEANLSENTNTKEKDSLVDQYIAAYESTVVARYEKNFWDLVNLNETNSISWSPLNFEVLYKYESKEDEYLPFLIYTKFNNSDYNYFYVSAVRYKGKWYLEDKMELTKGAKYEARD